MPIGRNRADRRGLSLARLLARGLAVGRLGIGVALVAAPGPATRLWLGARSADDPAREVAVRGLGARDVVLGVGALVALRSGGEVRHAARWIEAGIVADLADAAAMVVAEELETPKAPVVSLALTGAAVGSLIRARLR